MPKVVDHSLRREEVIDAALKVIFRLGLEKTTIRDIADEAGFSIGVLAHYFKNKDDILKSSFQAISTRAFERIQARASRCKTPLERVALCIEEFLPHEHNEPMAIVSLTFWTAAFHDPVLAGMIRQGYDAWRQLIRTYMLDAIAEGQIIKLKEREIECEIDLIISVTDGLMTSTCINADRFTKQRQRDVYRRVIDRLRV